MTCAVCRADTILGILLLPGIWTNARGDELAVRDEVPLCAECLRCSGDQVAPLRPDAEALDGEVEAWRRGLL